MNYEAIQNTAALGSKLHGRMNNYPLLYIFDHPKNLELSLPNTTQTMVNLTSSEIDRPPYCSSALQRAGIEPLSDEQVTHLVQRGKAKNEHTGEAL